MNQKKKKTLLGIGVFLGMIFQFLGIMCGAEHMRTLSVICISLGAMLFPVCVNRLNQISREKEFPEIVRREQIEMADERNVQIRNRAKAKSSDISRWVIIGLSWVNYLVKGSLDDICAYRNLCDYPYSGLVLYR